MSDMQKSDENLTDFEVQLAALRPRADRLDAGWRSLLAKEASLTAEVNLPSPIGRGAGGEGSADRDMIKEALTLALSQRERGRCAGLSQRERGQVPSCINPTGHRFVCVHCGNEAMSASVLRRRTLPTALAAVTGVAAAVLVMLLTHWGATAGLPGSAPHHRATALAGLATDNGGQPGIDAGDYATSSVCLRAEVLRHGVEWLDRRHLRATTPLTSPDRPLSNRDFLDRILAEQRGS
jgi:hypothetical protein